MGARITFKLSVNNDSDRTVTNLLIWDTLPVEVMYLSYGGTIAPVVTGNHVSFLYPSLAAGSTAVSYIVAMITSYNENTSIVNVAWCDYNDGFYASPFKHPAVFSDMCFYPGEVPVIYPNPYNPDTAVNGTLKFLNLKPGTLIQLFTVSGETVCNITTKTVLTQWKGINMFGNKISPGIYFYMIKTSDDKRYTGKIYVIK